VNHWRRNSALAIAVCMSSAASAATFHNFDGTGTPYAPAQLDNAPSPTQVGGGPTGAFLRIATATLAPPNHNTVAFDLTDPGAYPRVVVDFDFRINGQADGLGFALLNTANFGTSGQVGSGLATPVAEEPNYSGSLGIGLDIYQNGDPIFDFNANHVSIHFDGQRIGQVDATPVMQLASTEFNHVRIILRPGGGFSDISVILTPNGGQPVTLVDRFPVPGLDPYEGRVLFGARSGGLSANHDVDNIVVEFFDPAVAGEWTAVVASEIVAIHINLLPTGKVLYWEGRADADGDKGDIDEVRLLDPVTDQVSNPGPPCVGVPDCDIFCSGHSLMGDGKLLVAGGHIEDNTGLSTARLYDPFSNSWVELPTMNNGRWYPTVTVLANGDALVVSGDITPGNVNPTPQVLQRATLTWRSLADFAMHLYPFMFVAPNGMTFNAGPNQDARYLDTSGPGAWLAPVNSNFGIRSDASAVMYDPGKVLIVGGDKDGSDLAESPTTSAETIDLNLGNPSWTYTNPMAYARKYHDATILPDGTVLVTGGSGAAGFNDGSEAVHAAERWDPESGTWSTLARMLVPRVYHSTALLLPDGRVLKGGGGQPAQDPNGSAWRSDHTVFEYYSPPYLFSGVRPTITSAPASIRYGQTFFVETPDAADIAMATLIRLGSVTHAFDSNQRFSQLQFSAAANGLNVSSPTNGSLAPPGHYMLFVVTDTGVPSLGRIVRVSQETSVPALSPHGVEALLAVLTILAIAGIRTARRCPDRNGRGETNFRPRRKV